MILLAYLILIRRLYRLYPVSRSTPKVITGVIKEGRYEAFYNGHSA